MFKRRWKKKGSNASVGRWEGEAVRNIMNNFMVMRLIC